MGRRTAGLASAALLYAMALGACGDDGGGGLTKAEFLEKGNAICSASEQRIVAAAPTAFPDQGRAPTVEQIEAFATTTVAPEVQGQIRELDALDPPSEDRGRVGDILGAARSGVDKVKNDPTSVQSRDLNPFERYDELAADYGLEACGNVSANVRSLMSGITRS